MSEPSKAFKKKVNMVLLLLGEIMAEGGYPTMETDFTTGGVEYHLTLTVKE